MKYFLLALTCLAATLCSSNAEGAGEGRIFSLFNIVKFPNDVCVSNNLNGTCYTTDECTTRGGTAGTACGGGFGVCCTIVLSCGNTTSDNNTYLTQAALTTLATPCTYTICKSDPAITRIKYDFRTLVLASQTTGTVTVANTAAADAARAGAVGDCSVDTFNINNPGGVAPPQICGTNSGQHMIVDASDDCHTVTVNVGGSATSSRSWTIVVSQYVKSQEDAIVGGRGCLQFFTGTSGRFANYGMATNVAAAAFGNTQTHLNNQNYNVCFRRENGNCNICFTTAAVGTASSITIMTTFGLSVSTAVNMADSGLGTDCLTDFIEIPGATTQTIAQTSNGNAGIASRFCGRHLDTQRQVAAAAIQVSVCTRTIPFVVSVVTDASEVIPAAIAAKETGNEQVNGPAGTLGFDLTYAQSTTGCP